jgi:GTPase involved in cell partitioning and DNA repair
MFGSRGRDAFYARDGEPDSADGGDGTDVARADPDIDTLTSIEGAI